MPGPIQVYRLHPNSLKEAEYLCARWNAGRLTVTYARHEHPNTDEMYIQEWVVECPEPRVTERRHRSANLMQFLDEMEGHDR